MKAFSRSNFDAKRRQKLARDFQIGAFVQLGIAVLLFFANPFLGIWLGTSGAMFGGLAGGMRLPDFMPQSKFRRIKNAALRLKTFRSVRSHNHARGYHSVSRPACARASGDDSSGGGSDSDSGDPPEPGFTFPVTPSNNFTYKKTDSFLPPWRFLYGPGCCRMDCNPLFYEGGCDL